MKIDEKTFRENKDLIEEVLKFARQIIHRGLEKEEKGFKNLYDDCLKRIGEAILKGEKVSDEIRAKALEHEANRDLVEDIMTRYCSMHYVLKDMMDALWEEVEKGGLEHDGN